MDIGTRMKNNYEFPARRLLTRRTPVIVRVDGRAFHTYTKGMDKPFDRRLMGAMVQAATETLFEIQGGKLAYCQSDEASFLLTDYDTHETEPWFGYVQNKLESITASIFTAEFNHSASGRNLSLAKPRLAYFDARAFNVPPDEVANYFLWRAKDWERNSVAMYCGHFFSHEQMHGQGRADQHEMLHKIGRNWTTDLSTMERNGTWIFANGERSNDILPTYADIGDVVNPLVQLS